MPDIELTEANLATREAIADLLPIPSAYGKLYLSGSQAVSVTTSGTLDRDLETLKGYFVTVV